MADHGNRELKSTLKIDASRLIADRYRLRRALGVGGTSEVWLADDERLGRVVAVKFLKQELAIERMAARVVQEARAAAQLNHPAIVTIYDVGQLPDRMPFVVMEHLVGRTLREMIERRGRMAALDIVSGMIPIVDGLAAAHGLEIVHRDVKPDNVFLSRLDRSILQPKILDFGVARAANMTDRRLTVLGTLVGTPAYMSPEQTIGDSRVGPPTDVWGVGVTLFEAMTGSLPFAGESMAELFRNICVAPLPYPREIEDFDPALFSILCDATRKKPDERITLQTLLAKLIAWAREQGGHSDFAGRHFDSYGELV